MEPLPGILTDYLNYLGTIKGRSPSTIREYQYDLKRFLQYMSFRLKLASISDMGQIPMVDVQDFSIGQLKKIKITDLHSYISYLDKECGNSNQTRARKIASIRSFYDYLCNKVVLLDNNPTEKLDNPKLKNRHPIYLTLNESITLLNVVREIQNNFIRTRDFAILLLFLNCGMRLSELSSIKISKLKEDTLTVIGKGNKERTIYLNDACLFGISEYLKTRPPSDDPHLFISIRKTGLSNRAIQHRIEYYLQAAGFDLKVYSTHKLRHTAATLMYKYGEVDIRTLQKILGHRSVSTTQIYTHLDDDQLRAAVNKNPLANWTEKNKEFMSEKNQS